MDRSKINWSVVIKEGNVVRIREFDDMKREFGTYYKRGDSCFDPCTLIINCRGKFTEEMKKYCGETIRITKNMEKKFNEYGYFYYEGSMFSTDMLEPYVEPYEEELDVINIPVKDEYLKDSHEEKQEKEISYLEKEWGIKDNILYGIIYE